MITRRTVLVLGAGASKPYGYPLGGELRNQICGVWRRGREPRSGNVTSWLSHAELALLSHLRPRHWDGIVSVFFTRAMLKFRRPTQASPM